jgi:hypothetical protein
MKAISPNEKHNRLTILEEVEPVKSGNRYRRCVRCQCECGNIGTYLLYAVRNGNTKSCGCLRVDSNIKKNKLGTGKKENNM